MNTPGKRIKDERNDKHWSQQKLANEISRIKGESISRAAIAQWEIGSSKTQTPENFFAAAQALGLNPQWVLNGSGEKYATQKSERASDADNHVAEEPKVTYNVAFKTQRDHKIEELMELAKSMSDEGLLRLLGVAQQNAIQYPATKQTPKSSQ